MSANVICLTVRDGMLKLAKATFYPLLRLTGGKNPWIKEEGKSLDKANLTKPTMFRIEDEVPLQGYDDRRYLERNRIIRAEPFGA